VPASIGGRTVRRKAHGVDRLHAVRRIGYTSPMSKTANPVLKKLGLSDRDRAVIIHTDDIGMCQASVEAFSDLHRAGIVSSGAVMVPCPWFLHAAAFARENPKADLGVHLTLTCEYPTYRWGPVSTRDPASGLLDGEGYFPRKSVEVQERGVPAAVGVELRAQVRMALQAGIVPTHVDTHMGAVASARFMEHYVGVAMENGLPLMAFRIDEAGFRAAGLDAGSAVIAARTMERLEGEGFPLLDNLAGMPLDRDEDRLACTKKALSALPPGITHFIIHPAKGGPEIRAIAKDWRYRTADHAAFLDEEMRKHIASIGLHVIGYRDLKALLPGV
jgi:chitin disaccharide deacetylase